MKRIASSILCLVMIVSLSFPVPGARAYGEGSAGSGSGYAAGASADLVTATAAPQATQASDPSVEDSSVITGAPRAAGRTAETVKALTDAAVEVTKGYSLGELSAAGVNIPATVHVGQFGAVGDGKHDDHDALQAAFDSGASTVLFEKGAVYKVNRSLGLRHGDVTVLGNGATIVTDADYIDKNERLLSVMGTMPSMDVRAEVADNWKDHPECFIGDIGIYQLNLAARAYDPATAPENKTKDDHYNMLLMVQMAHNVDVFDCSLTIEQPTDGCVVDGCTALDAYTGWHDLTVEDCTVRDFCDAEGGGGMWIRDLFNMGASNIVFTGNDLHKVCHDEILAVFHGGTGKETAAEKATWRIVSDVLIANNTFEMDEAEASSSVMAFTVNGARNVIIEQNEMNVKTTGGLVWSEDSAGVVARDNDIAQARSCIKEGATTNFLMFRGSIDLVEDNRVTLSGLDDDAAEKTRNDVYVFSMDGTVRANHVVSDLALSDVTNGGAVIADNRFELNAPVHVIFNGATDVEGNKVELNAHADTYFQFYKTAFAQDVTISSNELTNKVAGDTHTVVMLNNATMNGHVVNVTYNRIVNEAGLGSGARLLFLKLLDKTPQKNCVVFEGNCIPDLKKYGVYCPDAQHTYKWPERSGWSEDNADWTPAQPHERPDLSLSKHFMAQSVGFGGHGAVFDPVISPFDSDTMIVDCDMGGTYVTHDGGGNWDMKSLGGRIWDIQADPTRAGVFYAAGSGLWRTQDNGDSWQLLWPNPDTVTATPTRLNQKFTYYFSTDSYPDSHVVESLRVDPEDGRHLVAITSAAANAADGGKYWRRVFESLDGGATFECRAEFQQQKDFMRNGTDNNFNNTRVFIEHGRSSKTSRVVIANPDGIYELNRSAVDVRDALTALYEPPREKLSLTIQDAQQVIDDDGAHYIVLENVDAETAAAKKCRVKLWHTTDFADESAKVDLTDELVASLPRHYNSQADGLGVDNQITMHNVMAVTAPSMERMYLTYRTYDATGGLPSYQGANGLVAYYARPDEGEEKFQWLYGLRLWWSGEDRGKRITPDQNQIMARAHCDSAYTFLGMAVDPRDMRRILLTTHDGAMYSPNIDADVGQRDYRDRVNIYPRYATYAADNPDNEKPNPSENLMTSNGLEVTVTTRIAQDPFDADHLLLGMDDAGLAESFDGAKTWIYRYTKHPSDPVNVRDTCREIVFDEGTPGVVYAFWHGNGGRTTDGRKDLLTVAGRFAISFDGGKTWKTEYSTGLPDACAGTRIAIVYPRDEQGNITDGERTLYVSTMGHGFFVSVDSGRRFTPMNEGIPTMYCQASKTVGVDAVWARDVLVTDDGRIFGMTQYSSLGPANHNGNSTYHSDQDYRTYGNVWEWDASANDGVGQWVRLPFNTAGSAYENGLQVRQPRAMCYDAKERALYVAAVSCIGYSGSLWDNFGGGMYVYKDKAGTPVGEGVVSELEGTQALLGTSRNMTGAAFDASGRLWIATEDGSAYVRDGWGEGGWTQVCADVPSLGQGLDPMPDGTVFLTTTGASSVRMTEIPLKWGAWKTTKAATCTAAGSKQRVDTIDPLRKETQTVAKLGHSWAKVYTVEKAATCTASGVKSIHCTRCSARKDETKIAALGHKWKSGYTVDKAATRTKAGEKSIHCTRCSSRKNVTTIPALGRLSIAKATVTLAATKRVYTGKALKPSVKSVKLKASGKTYTLKKGRDYTVDYSANKNVGVAKVKLTGKGDYKGTRAVSFKIVPKGTSLTKLVSAKRGFTAKWKRQSKQVGGYQVQYALKSNFKAAKTKKVAKPKATSVKLTKLKPGKRYYVRVCTYKKVSGKMYYSSWSKAKSVKTKR